MKGGTMKKRSNDKDRCPDYRDVRQAAACLKRVRNSYSGPGRSFACQPFSVRTLSGDVPASGKRYHRVPVIPGVADDGDGSSALNLENLDTLIEAACNPFRPALWH